MFLDDLRMGAHVPRKTKGDHGSCASYFTKNVDKLWITVSLVSDSLIRSGVQRVAQKSRRLLLSLTTTYSASTEESAVITQIREYVEDRNSEMHPVRPTDRLGLLGYSCQFLTLNPTADLAYPQGCFCKERQAKR